jgi:hypothetical protein
VKVDGKTGNLAGKVNISRDTSKVSFSSTAATSKRCAHFCFSPFFFARGAVVGVADSGSMDRSAGVGDPAAAHHSHDDGAGT